MTPEEERKYLEKCHLAWATLFVDYWDLPLDSVVEDLEELTEEEQTLFASVLPRPVIPRNPDAPPCRPPKLDSRGRRLPRRYYNKLGPIKYPPGPKPEPPPDSDYKPDILDL